MNAELHEDLASARFELLKQEIDNITTTIRHVDSVCQFMKNWAITLWLAGMGLCFSEHVNNSEVLMPFVGLVPLLFWYSDVHWSRQQRKFMYRYEKIMRYINSKDFVADLGKSTMSEFRIMDVQSRSEREDENFKQFTNFWLVVKYRSITPFYLSLSLLSLCAWVIWAVFVNGNPLP